MFKSQEIAMKTNLKKLAWFLLIGILLFSLYLDISKGSDAVFLSKYLGTYYYTI